MSERKQEGELHSQPKQEERMQGEQRENGRKRSEHGGDSRRDMAQRSTIAPRVEPGDRSAHAQATHSNAERPAEITMPLVSSKGDRSARDQAEPGNASRAQRRHAQAMKHTSEAARNAEQTPHPTVQRTTTRIAQARIAQADSKSIMPSRRSEAIVPASSRSYTLPTSASPARRGDDGSGSSAGSRRGGSETQEAPTISVSIGRIDVRAARPMPSARTVEVERAMPKLSLAEYLQSRTRRER